MSENNGIDYKAKCEEYEKIIGVGEHDVARSAFYALCRIADLQTKRLNKFNIETEIAKDSKEDKIYDRTMDIVVKMPKMITDINSLRKELGLTNKNIQEEVFVDSIAETRK